MRVSPSTRTRTSTESWTAIRWPGDGFRMSTVGAAESLPELWLPVGETVEFTIFEPQLTEATRPCAYAWRCCSTMRGSPRRCWKRTATCSKRSGRSGRLRPNRAPAILVGVSLLLVVGIIDDTRGMRALVKLAFQVAAALIAAAEGWLRGRGMTRALGPISISIWDEPGLLVKGFEQPPTVMMPQVTFSQSTARAWPCPSASVERREDRVRRPAFAPRRDQRSSTSVLGIALGGRLPRSCRSVRPASSTRCTWPAA